MLEYKIQYVLKVRSSIIEKKKVLFEDGIPTHYMSYDEKEKKFGTSLWEFPAEWMCFDTPELAAAALASKTPSREEIDKVMAHFARNHDSFEKSFNEHFGKNRYDLPRFIIDRLEDDDVDEDVPDGDLLDAIHQFIQEGTLNIDALTFRKQDVKYVKWGFENQTDFEGFKDEDEKRPIELILGDNTKVYLRNAKERWFVKLAFGANYISDSHFEIKIPKIPK